MVFMGGLMNMGDHDLCMMFMFMGGLLNMGDLHVQWRI